MCRRLWQQERGAVMVLAAVTLTILLLFAGLVLDFGRAHLLRAQLQTAVDAASLAGALQVVPMVELEVRRWRAYEEWCVDPVTEEQYRCLQWRRTSPARASGTQWELIHLGQWRQAIRSQCRWPYRCANRYTIVREWLVLPSSTVPMAENTFYLNANWPQGRLAPRVRRLRVTTNQARAEVTATATLSMPTTFLKLVGIRELEFTRTGTAVPVRRGEDGR